MGSVYLLTLRQLAGKWRLVIMALLAALPFLFTFITLSESSAPPVRAFETIVLNGMLAGTIIPLVVLAIAGAAFANEVEDRTLANLTLAPIARWRIVLPKLLGAITLAAPFAIAGAIAVAVPAYLAEPRAVAAVALGALAAVALYAAAFVWLGLVTTQAIGIGLLYVVVWEGLFAGFVSGARLLSIRYTATAIMHAADPRRFTDSSLLGPVAAVVVAAVVFAAFTLLAIRRLRRMDVP